MSALASASNEIWQIVPTRLAQNTFLTIVVYGTPGSPFHAFYWACFTVSTTSLPRPATLVLGPTVPLQGSSISARFTHSWVTLLGRSRILDTHSHSWFSVTYLIRIFLRWVMAATMTRNQKGKLLIFCFFRFVAGCRRYTKFIDKQGKSRGPFAAQSITIYCWILVMTKLIVIDSCLSLCVIIVDDDNDDYFWTSQSKHLLCMKACRKNVRYSPCSNF